VIIAHNHPSGDPLPSEEDIELTKRITKALDLVGINLLDHIVIGKESWKSISC
jgi:DNA repair protein RadC